MENLEDFDWTFQPRAGRLQIESVAACSYVRDKTNVLFLGPPGVGKSHALSVKAIKNGFSVSHFVLDDLMHKLRADAAIPPQPLRVKRYFTARSSRSMRSAFVRSTDRNESLTPHRPRATNAERASWRATKHVRDWPGIFAGDEILTTPILDRLLHRIHVIHIYGRRYRLRDLDALLNPATEPRLQPPTLGGTVPPTPNPNLELVREFACQFSTGIWVYLHNGIPRRYVSGRFICSNADSGARVASGALFGR
jgi:hypothetical protein